MSISRRVIGGLDGLDELHTPATGTRRVRSSLNEPAHPIRGVARCHPLNSRSIMGCWKHAAVVYIWRVSRLFIMFLRLVIFNITYPLRRISVLTMWKLCYWSTIRSLSIF